MASKKLIKYIFDRKSGRWRKNGKYSSPPKISDLAKDKAGNRIDASGKRVSKTVLASLALTKRKPPKKKAPKKAAKKKKAVKKPSAIRDFPKPKKRKPRKKRPIEPLWRRKPVELPSAVPPRKRKKPRFLPNVRFAEHGTVFTKKSLISSTFENKKPPELAHEVLEKTIRNKAYKARMKMDDVMLYSAGVQFVNDSMHEGDIGKMEKFATELGEAYPELRFLFDADSLHVFLGDGETPMSVMPGISSTRITASTELERITPTLEDIWGILQDIWDTDSIGWYVFAENDELEGGS